jgi:type III secretion protein U
MSEKTEQPTAKRLREGREKGQVAKSQEVGSAASILVVMTVCAVRFDENLAQLDLFCSFAFEAMLLPFREAAPAVAGMAFGTLAYVSVPFLVAAPLAGIVAHFGQVGMLLAFKGAMPSLDKLSPKNWINKVFSKKALLEIGKTLAKVLALAWILSGAVLKNIDPLLHSGFASPEYFLAVFGAVLTDILLRCALVFTAVAAVDYLLQKHLFLKQMMMSKDEVKREYKEMEGDPHIRSRRKALHQEMAMDSAIRNTRNASVLVTNPTRIAVALYYKEGETPLPVVTAMGQGALAAKMREVAEQEGIPVMENVPLARDLLEQGETGNYIPRELLDPVAEVIRWLNEQKAGAGEW